VNALPRVSWLVGCFRYYCLGLQRDEELGHPMAVRPVRDERLWFHVQLPLGAVRKHGAPGRSRAIAQVLPPIPSGFKRDEVNLGLPVRNEGLSQASERTNKKANKQTNQTIKTQSTKWTKCEVTMTSITFRHASLSKQDFKRADKRANKQASDPTNKQTNEQARCKPNPPNKYVSFPWCHVFVLDI
jgi:hypothetical protein